jgi:5-formyltetrahydrofolate cyclo-ligase
MAVPRLAEEEPFVLVRGDPTIKRALAEGRRLALDELEPVDLIVCGTVAVNRKGVRVGKGGGFSDLEFALLVERGLVGDETTIVTTIHPLQLLDEQLPETAHDFRVDVIVTRDTVLRTRRSRRPPGLLRHHLDDDKRAAIPVLRDWSAMTLLALTKHNGIRIAEVGFALAAIAGAVFAFGGGRRSGELLGGLVLAVAGVLLVVAAHWGHFG